MAWEDYEFSYSPFWYKCVIMLMWIGGTLFFYHTISNPLPDLPPMMIVGDMVEHHNHGWVVIEKARYTQYFYRYRCRVIETGEEVEFTNFDLMEDFNYVSGNDVARRLDSI